MEEKVVEIAKSGDAKVEDMPKPKPIATGYVTIGFKSGNELCVKNDVQIEWGTEKETGKIVNIRIVNTEKEHIHYIDIENIEFISTYVDDDMLAEAKKIVAEMQAQQPVAAE